MTGSESKQVCECDPPHACETGGRWECPQLGGSGMAGLGVIVNKNDLIFGTIPLTVEATAWPL